MTRKAFITLLLLLCCGVGSAQDFGLVPYRVKNKWGFADSLGNIKIKPQYQDVIPFNKGYAAYKNNGKWGFIDIKGKVLVKPQFDSVCKYFMLYAVYDVMSGENAYTPGVQVYQDGSLITVDTKGEKINVDRIMFVDDNLDVSDWGSNKEKGKLLTIYRDKEQYGFVNSLTKQRFEPKYDSLLYVQISDAPNTAYMLAVKNGLWGIVDADNQLVADFQYEEMFKPDGNREILKVKKNGLWGVVDMQNKTLINCEYNDINLIVKNESNYSYCILEKENKYKVFSFSLSGMVSSTPYTLVTPDKRPYHSGFYFTVDNGSVGYYDIIREEVRTEPKYKWIDFYDYYYTKLIIFKENNLFGYEFNGPDSKVITVSAKYNSIAPFASDQKYTIVTTINNKKGYINLDGLEFFKD